MLSSWPARPGRLMTFARCGTTAAIRWCRSQLGVSRGTERTARPAKLLTGRRVGFAILLATIAAFPGSLYLAQRRDEARAVILYRVATKICRKKVQEGADPISEFWCYRARQVYSERGSVMLGMGDADVLNGGINDDRLHSVWDGAGTPGAASAPPGIPTPASRTRPINLVDAWPPVTAMPWAGLLPAASGAAATPRDRNAAAQDAAHPHNPPGGREEP